MYGYTRDTQIASSKAKLSQDRPALYDLAYFDHSVTPKEWHETLGTAHFRDLETSLYVEDGALVRQAVNLLSARDMTARQQFFAHHVLQLFGGSRQRAGDDPHRFRLVAEEPPLHRLDEGKHNSPDKAGSSGHRVDLEPNRVVPPSTAEMKHAHSLFALREEQTHNAQQMRAQGRARSRVSRNTNMRMLRGVLSPRK